MLQAESARVRSQLDQAGAEADEARAALKVEREKTDSAAMSAARHAELLEKVQTVSALNDSNRLLREERDRFAVSVTEQADKLAAAEARLKPVQERLHAMEGGEEQLRNEMKTLKEDNQRWRQRANQLIEKHQKINPEEMKRLQTDNSNLAKQVSQLHLQVRRRNYSLHSITIVRVHM